jgi:hypothetical protein
MHEGGPNAPVSEVANQLVKQQLGQGASENTLAVRDRVFCQVETDRKKVARQFAKQTKLAQAGKLGRGQQRDKTGANEIEDKSPGGTPAGNDPASAVAVVARTGTEASSRPGAEDVKEHVGEPDEKGKRKRGKRKRGRGGQGAKGGPDKQHADPVAVQGRPSRAPRDN